MGIKKSVILFVLLAGLTANAAAENPDEEIQTPIIIAAEQELEGAPAKAGPNIFPPI